MMNTTLFRVQLDHLFEGPIDLLLHLVRHDELNLLQVSLSRVTDQFCEYLEVLQFIDFDLAADFVVTASILVEMKSQQALNSTRQDDEIEDEAIEEESTFSTELIEHLLQYKKFKQASEALREQAEAWHDRFPRFSDERPSKKRSLAEDRILDVEVWDLVGAFSRICRLRGIAGEHQIRYDDTPIHVYIEQIGAQVRAEGKVCFQQIFEQDADRSQIVGMFLAVLELVRHHGFLAKQTRDSDDIWIYAPAVNSQEANP